MNLTKRCLLIALAAMALTLNACKPGELSVDELLKKHYEAVGQEKLAKVQTVSMIASMDVMGSTMKLNVFFKRPKKVRTEVNMMGVTVLMTMDGERGYMAAPNQDVKEMTKEEMEKSLPQNIAMDDQLFQAQSQGVKYTLVGKEKTDAGEMYKLKMDYSGTNTGIDSATAYLNAKTFYLDKMVSTQKVNGNPSTATMKFTEFKTVDGITMPYLIVISTSMSKDIPMKFEKLEYNTPLNDTLFAKPQMMYAPLTP